MLRKLWNIAVGIVIMFYLLLIALLFAGNRRS